MPSLSVQDVTVGEGDGFLNVVVALDVASSSAVSVAYRQINDTAGDGGDYRYVAGTLNFAAGETRKTVRVDLVNNTVVEGTEQFYFYLDKPTNATISRELATVTVIDNDTVVNTPQLFVRDLVVDEKAGTASFVVRLGNSLGEASGSTVTVNYSTSDGSAIAGQDYSASSGSLSFAPGESVKTVVVDLIDDSLAEGPERFNLTLSNPVNAAIADGVALAEIGLSEGTNASQPRISVADRIVGEGDGQVEVVVSLHAPSNNTVTVDYRQINDTAGDGGDYRYQAGTLHFAPGETTKAVRLALVDGVAVEATEQFYFYLDKPTNASISRESATVTVIDNDTIVDTPQLFVRDVLVDEKAGTATFAVRLGNSLGEASGSTVTVNYSTGDGTAIAGQDFVARNGTLSFAPGDSLKTVVVDLTDDTVAEGLERFNFSLSNPVNAGLADGAAVAEIGLSDGTNASQPRISVADRTVGEGDGVLEMMVSLHAPSNNTVTVDYRQINDTAGDGGDYRYQSGTLHFAPGETTKAVRLALVDGVAVEATEQFYFYLDKPTNASISRELATVTVIDNDTVVDTPRLFVRDVAIDEKAGTATFAVRLGNTLGEASGSTVTVNYSTSDGTAIAGQDFVARNGTLSFAPGDSLKIVVVDLVDDALAEKVERFNFSLSNPVNATLADGVGVAEIGLSDGTPASQPRISVADRTVGEADGHVDVTVNLHAPSASTVTVDYRQSNDTAGDGGDYRYQAGTLHFAPGETTKTVRLALVDNAAVENQETFRFILSTPTNATLANATANVITVDNDGERPLLSYGRSNDVYTIDSTALDFIEATDGGFDVVRSSVSFTLPATLEGVILTGQALNATGNDGANFFQVNGRSNSIDGKGGIDTVLYTGRLGDYALSGPAASRTVVSAAEGTDTLLSIERLRFSDTVLAYDTTAGGHTWSAYAMFNAGFNVAPNAAQLSQWTAQLDQLGNPRDLAQAMIHFYAPGVSNESLVAHLWGTIVETPLAAADLAYYVGLIENGSFTQASLVEFVTTHPLNTDEIVSIVGQPVVLDAAWFALPGA